MSIRRPADNELDRLLASAQWPEPNSAQVERLADQWRTLRGRRRTRQRVAMALAASLVVVVAGVFAWQRQLAVPPQVVADKPVSVPTLKAPIPAVPIPAVPIPAAAVPEQRVAETPRVRDPSAYEQVLLISRIRTHHRAQQTNQPAGTADRPQLASATDAQVPPTDPAAAPAPTVASTPPTVDQRPADSSSSDRLPLEPALDELLASPTPPAIGQYLQLVADPSSRDLALEALARSAAPPIDPLAAYLGDPRKAVRLAAAQALSTLDDARAAERLIESVPGIGRQEALMALLVSPSPRAGELVREARQNVYLMASLRAAEQQLTSMQNQNGEILP